MKLSKAQLEVMTRAKANIDFARTHTIREWAQKKSRNTDEEIERMVERAEMYGMTKEEMKNSCEKTIQDYINNYKKYYQGEKEGVVLTQCNSKTLYKLEEMKLIEIIRDSKGQTYGIDTIKVLNY